MRPDTPVLMIAIQVPLLQETNAEEVLEAIRHELAAALREVKRRHGISASDADRGGTMPAIPRETDEPFSPETREDLLARLGYTADH